MIKYLWREKAEIESQARYFFVWEDPNKRRRKIDVLKHAAKEESNKIYFNTENSTCAFFYLFFSDLNAFIISNPTFFCAECDYKQV